MNTFKTEYVVFPALKTHKIKCKRTEYCWLSNENQNLFVCLLLFKFLAAFKASNKEANNNQEVYLLNGTDWLWHSGITQCLISKSHPLFSVASHTLTAFCGTSSRQSALKMFWFFFFFYVFKNAVNQLFKPKHEGLIRDHRFWKWGRVFADHLFDDFHLMWNTITQNVHQ